MLMKSLKVLRTNRPVVYKIIAAVHSVYEHDESIGPNIWNSSLFYEYDEKLSLFFFFLNFPYILENIIENFILPRGLTPFDLVECCLYFI